MQQRQTPDATTREPEAFDLDAALEQATIAMTRANASGRGTKSMTQTEREATLVSLARALGLNPLTNPVQFLPMQGGEVLYVTRQATDQIAARLKLRRETIIGPELREVGKGVTMVFCQVRVTSPDGRSEVATATIPLKDACNDLMKCETKAKRRATLSLAGLGLLTEEETETIPSARQSSEQREPAPSTWLPDLATCSRLAEVRACYQSAANPDADNRALCDDVRAWLRARGLCADQAETTALLSTMESALLTALDGATLEPGEDTAPRPDTDALTDAARTVKAHPDSHGTRLAWKIIARSYGIAEKVPLNEAATILKKLCDTPPEGDGPKGGTPKPAPAQATDATGTGQDTAPAQGAQASAEAWRETKGGITAHVARIGSTRHLESSARQHLRAVPEALQLHALHVYAGRAQRLSHDGATSLPWDECVARAEAWMREGPKVARLPVQRERNPIAAGAR